MAIQLLAIRLSTDLSPNYRSASVSVRFTDGRGNGFRRTVFDLYPTAVGVENNSLPEQ